MSIHPKLIVLPTRRLDAAMVDLLQSLQLGDRISITQKVRVGGRSWETTVTGIYRGVNYLATGVTTERVAEDDIVVPTVHFTKDSGELASISLDENTKIARA
jgi:hypothetical protein